MRKSSLASTAALGTLLVTGLSATAQPVFFSDNFDGGTSALDWTVNTSATGTHPVNFAFDYSTIGIPSAPNSGGTTIGLKMQANTAGTATAGGVSVSPTGQSFTGDFVLRYDLWMNYQGGTAVNRIGAGGTAGAGGNGTTQMAGAGIGTDGGSAQVFNASTTSSLFFGSTGDGGSSVDYRVYSSAAPAASGGTGYGDANAVFAAAGVGNRNDSHTYYHFLGEKTAPADQVTDYPEQTGTTRIGAAGFAWRDIEIKKLGNTVTWSMDGTLLATVDTTSLTFSGNNILINYYDLFSGISTDANHLDLLFGLVDNVRVVSTVPEPSSVGLALLGGAGLFFAVRRRK